MGALVARRAARALATLLAVAVLAWLGLEAAPGTPAERAARAAGTLGDGTRPMPPELRQRIIDEAARAHGLDRPAPARLASFVGGLVRGDLGTSWRDRRSVGAAVARALPTTLALVVAGLIAAYLVGLAMALAAASAHGRRLDSLVRALCAIALAVPTAWGAVLALRALAAGHPFGWFPPAGGESAAGWVLPVACVAYVAAATVARHGRATLVTALEQPFCDAARARGASPARVLGVHALAWSGPPLAALAAALVPHLIAASLVVERAFDMRGVGELLLEGAGAGDAPVVLGATLAIGALVALASIAADVVGALADPRLRTARRA